MDEMSLNKPLISSKEDGYSKEPSLLVWLAKWILKVVMWMLFVCWVVIIFLYPGEFGDQVIRRCRAATSGTLFGITGSMFFIFSGPVLVIAVLAVLYLSISGEEEFAKMKKSKFPRYKLWTFPVLVDGPFGVVSVAEFLGILFFAIFLLWAIYAYTMRNLSLLSSFQVPPKEQGILLLEVTGVRLGMIGMFCMAFLFLPISRGSVLLRLIDIPFEHATRYHVWLGHITMALFSLHGLCFVIGWAIQGELKRLSDWRTIGISNFPGVISLLAGLLMWVTSLNPVRKHNFELFFYTHQLYVVFVVFLALHIGDFLFSITAGGIFIFILDRFLRFCQSRKTVDVLSAKSLPCGSVELVLSKPSNLRYNALSFIFIQVRELSWLQWHPFSVSSSPLDGKYHIAVLIKVLGKWTAKLRDNILRISEAEQERLPPESHPKITASVEGPYGHESPYHLMYENLILVAGGIGVSPFFAILSDVLHRIRDGKPCLPKKILVVWAIKKSDELALLSTIDLHSICPSFSDKLKLEINIFITRQLEPRLEEGMVHKDLNPSVRPASNGCPMSVLVGTGDNLWSGLYMISSTVGFIAMLALLDIFYINKYNIKAWWYKGLLFVACMVASVLVFGGLVVVFWHLWGDKTSTKEADEDKKAKMNGQNYNGSSEHKGSGMESPESITTIQYGTRPDFKEIFGSLDEKWGSVDVGVLVCGPQTLQTTVAKDIRSHSIQRSAHQPVFHFHSHSFDL